MAIKVIAQRRVLKIGKNPAEQKAAMRRLLEDLHRRYPKALIVGHHDLDPTKPCPCIRDVAQEYGSLQPK